MLASGAISSPRSGARYAAPSAESAEMGAVHLVLGAGVPTFPLDDFQQHLFGLFGVFLGDDA